MREKKPKKNTAKKHVYVGPPIMSIKPFTVYKGNLPAALSKLIKKCPELSYFIVSPGEAVKTYKKARTKGDPLFLLYCLAEKKFKEE